jgi:hypothetical protein
MKRTKTLRLAPACVVILAAAWLGIGTVQAAIRPPSVVGAHSSRETNRLPPVVTRPPACDSNITWTTADGYGTFVDRGLRVQLFMYGKKRGVPLWSTVDGYLAAGPSGGYITPSPGYVVRCVAVRWHTKGGFRYQEWASSGRGQFGVPIGTSGFFSPGEMEWVGLRIVRTHAPTSSAASRGTIEGTAKTVNDQVEVSGIVTSGKDHVAVAEQEVAVFSWRAKASPATLGHECRGEPTALFQRGVGAAKSQYVFGTGVTGTYRGTLGLCFEAPLTAFEVVAAAWLPESTVPIFSSPSTVELTG